jgi:SAM-dependent methyltransferase
MTVKELPQKVAMRMQPLIFHDRTDESGNVVRPTGIRKLALRVNQALMESGKTPPWILTQDEVQQYWSSIDTESAANNPRDYAEKQLAIVDFMHGFWSPEVKTSDSILECGTNAGANLERLRQLGYANLSGVEINPHALEQLRTSFPELAQTAKLTNGKFEEVLPGLPTGSVDVVYTMAVSIHIHPASHAVFGEMARIAGKYVCTLETEVANARYTFARNYRRVFERFGCKQVKARLITRESNPEVSRDYDGYVARLFQAPAR